MNWVFSRSAHIIALYRAAHYLHSKGIPVVPSVMRLIMEYIYMCEVHYGAEIGKEFKIHHGFGLVIGKGVKLGNNVHVNQGVTIGGNWGKSIDARAYPVVGNNVWIMAGAKVLGPVSVGDNVIVGANAVVIRDVPPLSVVGGVPARVLRSLDARDQALLARGK